ncbi:hypothetical protein SAMN00017405_1450 [Desulfonispora thiosulfatigenes DSM 11270]|uniref:Uncharacterized protein n=1 Tax=Desulfonispora thiosulfatigenes DSM 11270 TaxID=656914 RepID=A0A1W1VRQ4_DESTI|nr:hypothetical protein [Desulfonispora thiosulfatigenes]SMB96062.1 hypothetical protein SAMN00017405_1450 [Desulfonispora thiosulfatigenes DSM 11270]
MGRESLEKNIITKVDELVNIILNLEVDTKDYQAYKDSAIKKTEELIPLLTNFVEGNIDYIEPMLTQLIKERLPNNLNISTLDAELAKVIKAANGQESEELNEMLNETINPENLNDEKEQYKELSNSTENELQKSIKKVYPKGKILYNFSIRGQIVDAYLSDKKVALTSKKFNKSVEYFCKKQGIKIFYVPKEIRNDYRRLGRALKNSI